METKMDGAQKAALVDFVVLATIVSVVAGWGLGTIVYIVPALICARAFDINLLDSVPLWAIQVIFGLVVWWFFYRTVWLRFWNSRHWAAVALPPEESDA
jgi:hypothetical protein